MNYFGHVMMCQTVAFAGEGRLGLKADHQPEDKLIQNSPNQSLGFSLPIAWSLTSNGLSVSAHKTFFLHTEEALFVYIHND